VTTNKMLRLALVTASLAFAMEHSAAADTVWFEDAFATGGGKPAEHTGVKDPAATLPLPHVSGAGGDYLCSAYASGRDFDGYILRGANLGSGLIARFAMVQTTNTWRLADVPKGSILRFEMKGVSVGKAQRAEANEGFGLSDSRATVIHSKPAHNIIWTFYRPGQKPGGVRPYVQWPGNPYSSDTSPISAKLSTNPYKPDDLAIAYDPGKGAITFFHNRKPVYVFSDPQGIEALAKAPLAIVLRTNVNNIRQVEMAEWSLKLIDAVDK
jgi:hypothetical protein